MKTIVLSEKLLRLIRHDEVVKMEIRTFKGEDIDKIVNCWNVALPHDKVTKEEIIKKMLLDCNFRADGFFIACSGDDVVGFVNCVYRRVPIDAYSGLEDNNGWISAFAIKDDKNFAEIGDALLNAAEDYFKAHSIIEISTGYYPVYFYQGVSKEHCEKYITLFESKGYKCIPSLARELYLTEFCEDANIEQKREILEKEGIYTGPMQDKYILSLIDSQEPFNNISMAFEFKSRLAELDYERIRIAAKDGKVIGVCVFGDPYGSKERFGPFSVDASYQGKGIGKVLLNDCLSAMKERGLEKAWMQWTPLQGAADTLYKRVGFKVTKTYITFSKNI